MKKILIDLFPTQSNGKTVFHGGGEYAKEVFKGLMRYRKNQSLTFFYDSSRPLDSEIRKNLHAPGCRFLAIPPARSCQDILSNDEFDLFYSPLFSKFDINLRLGSTSFLVTIHGLRNLEMPRRDVSELHCANNPKAMARYLYRGLCQEHDIKRQLSSYASICHKANHLVVSSFHTKYAVLSAVKDLNPAKISVMYCPRKQSVSSPADGFPQRLGVNKNDYLLLISANRWLKNSCRAVQAIDNLYSMGAPIPSKTLVLGATSDRAISFTRNPGRFVLRGYVTDAELEACYRDASLFVYPTLNEGFGYPPLEAMKHGTPVVASAICSVPEICGDAVLYFNPFSVMEIQTRILQCISESILLSAMKVKGPVHVAKVGAQQDRMLENLCRLVLD